MGAGRFDGAPRSGGVPEGEAAVESAAVDTSTRVAAADPRHAPHADGADGAALTPPATAAGAAAAYAAASAAGAAASEADPSEPEPGAPGGAEPVDDPGAIEEDVTGTVVEPEADERVVLDIEELSARAEKADEYLGLAQRVRADFENYRKRATREAAAAQERGVAKLAKELLPAIDNLDRALQAAESLAGGVDEETGAATDSQLVSGIKLVHADVIAALARVGIEQFSPAGEQFDPTYHEAVAQAPIEGASTGTVVEVYQCGYRFGDTVLRPARVLVAA